MKQINAAIWRLLGTRINGDVGPYTFYWNKRSRLVMFLKTWPKDPATWWQTHNRNRWRHAGERWRSLDQQTRDDWLELGRRANLTISGYNLFIFYITGHDVDAIKTVQRIAKMDVITATGPPLPWPDT